MYYSISRKHIFKLKNSKKNTLHIEQMSATAPPSYARFSLIVELIIYKLALFTNIAPPKVEL